MSKFKDKYDYREVAKILGVDYQTVAKLCRAGDIVSKKIAGQYFINKRDLDVYMNTGDIFSKPEKVILDTIRQAIKEGIEEHIGKIELAVKQKIALELENNIKKNLLKISKKNKELDKSIPKESIKHLRYREKQVKKEFEKV